jgi:uncharacterized damage-inducible protein DinB
MDRGFQRLNDESRERLAALVATLTPTQLSIDLGEGWTVASALAHMGFWDRWQADRWEAMLAGGWTADSGSVLAAEHLANEALHPYWIGACAGDIPKLALEAAERVDALIASVPDEIAEPLEGTSIDFLLHRHRHRGDHLDHIERSIAAAAAAGSEPAGTAGSYVERNAASRRRLAAVVERLRVEDMALPTESTEEGSWTIAQVLAHIAFWDRSMEARWLLARDAAGGEEAGPIEPIYLPDGINEAINPPLAHLVGAWTERLGPAVGSEALAAAESLDTVIQELGPRLPAGTASVLPRVVHRWIHREAHLDQIERGLAAARPSATAATDPGSRERNDASRARLAELTSSISAEELALPVGDGRWTIGALLGHLAFWDRFLAARWRAALAAGATRPSPISHEVSDILNDALPASWAALAADAGALGAEVVAAATEVDSIIASLPATTPTGAIMAEGPWMLDRSTHRTEHLDAIAQALGRQLRPPSPSAAAERRPMA